MDGRICEICNGTEITVHLDDSGAEERRKCLYCRNGIVGYAGWPTKRKLSLEDSKKLSDGMKAAIEASTRYWAKYGKL